MIPPRRFFPFTSCSTMIIKKIRNKANIARGEAVCANSSNASIFLYNYISKGVSHRVVCCVDCHIL